MTGLSELTKKSMGEPVAPTFTDNELKVKRNILVLSAITLLIIFGLKSAPDNEESVTFTLFFVRSSHIDFNFIFMMLLVSLVYLLSNYCWLCTEYIAKWKIRVTGTKNPPSKPSQDEQFLRKVTNQHPYKDHNDSAEQSNLYSYLMIHQLYSDSFIDIQISEDEMKKYQEKARLMLAISEEESNKVSGYTVTNTDRDYWYSLLIEMRSTRELIQHYKKVMETPYLIESIKRFDENFLFFQNSQYRRHFIMELLPTYWVGFMAILSIVMKIWFVPSFLLSVGTGLLLSFGVLYLLNMHHKKNS
ncbi:hypothetical protein LYZ37_23780 (plasmid) [Vibrio tubiashii]|uniref:hypothetical protein n=1 Tax=Vibrio tubiashii TaxID=29498 RepID=UPI00234F6E32|nr:hypothetical protein [Vibrio tubiashii]WCP70189.1 hypothetical protein LYZ37_23780 [Vibrio tubiashii]